ncbi:hypothetical protein L6Q96_03560 [Candidatus Binatia bacterium]|nr:hypothetical protein [Candidatus Binatia bacterium]
MTAAIARIQIFGERCSGTNYLEHLLRRNVPDVPLTWDFGWKHFFHKPGVETAADCLFVVVYRNPFDWLRSLNRSPWHAAPALWNLDFAAFVRAPWWCVYDEHWPVERGDPRYGTELMFERSPETGERFANVVRLRSAKIRNWEALREVAANTAYVRYEDLNARPAEFVESLCSRFGLPRLPTFHAVSEDKGKRRRYRPKTYTAIAEADLEFILAELDVPLETRIGYDVRALAERVRAERSRPRAAGSLGQRLLPRALYRLDRRIAKWWRSRWT